MADRANAAATDGSSFYVTGDFTGTATFDGLSVTSTGPNASDIFLAKYDTNGLIQWLHHGGGVHPVWAGVPDNSYFYFVHSFYAVPQNPAHCAGQADYGGLFAAAVARDNIFATQFHPEKSAEHGLALYRNFLHWNP